MILVAPERDSFQMVPQPKLLAVQGRGAQHGPQMLRCGSWEHSSLPCCGSRAPPSASKPGTAWHQGSSEVGGVEMSLLSSVNLPACTLLG